MNELNSVFRRLVKSVIILLLVLLGLVLALPLWLPWAISGLGPRFGIEVGSCHRAGWSRLLLDDVNFAVDGVELAVDRISTPIWPLWVLSSKDADETPRPEIRIEGWRVVLSASDREAAPAEGSLSEVLRTVRGLMPDLRRYLPEILALDGRVTVGDKLILLERVQWRASELTWILSQEDRDWRAEGALRLPASDPWSMQVTAHPWKASLRASLLGPAERAEVALGVEWQESAFSGQIVFGDTGFLPETALIRSETLSLDARQLGLDGYEPVSGSAEGSWSRDHYRIEVDLKAFPLAVDNAVRPPLVATFEAEGDLESIELRSFELQVPWATARLSDSLVLAFGPGLMEQEAELEFDVDLGASPWPVGGRLSGLARVATQIDQWPTADFQLMAEDLEWADFNGLTGRAGFRLDHPMVHLDEVAIQMPGEVEVVFEGRADLVAETVEGTLAGWLEAAFLDKILPPDVSVGSFSMAGAIDGGWMAPDVTLMARAEGVDLPGVEPVTVDLGVTGCGVDLDTIIVQVSNGPHLLEVSGGVNLDAEENRLTLRRIRLLEGNRVRLASTADTRIHTDLKTQARGVVHLLGEDKGLRLELDARWPDAATWSLEARNLQSDLLNGFLEKDTNWFEVETVQYTGSWSDGPVAFSLASTGRVGTKDERFTYGVSSRGSAEGFEIDDLMVAAAEGDVLRAQGRVPVVFDPTAESLVDVGWDRPMDLTVRTSPNPEFWDRMAVLLGLDVSDPKLDLNLSGPARNPEGQLQIAASRIAWVPEDASEKVPAITAFDLKAEIQSDRVLLKSGGFKVEGETVSVTGDLPTGRDGWMRRLVEGERPDLQQASLWLRADDAQIKAFSAFLPNILAPTGRIDLDLQLSPGLNLAGAIVLEGAALRPIRPLGTMQEIEARIEFDGRQIHCDEVAAVIGGQRVSVAGDLSWKRDGAVAFEFSVKGKRVPLVREPGLVVRTDLDLKLTGTSERDALLSGTLGLSDSLFVADLNSLIAGNVDSPTMRPPYFSIDIKPFASWRLNIDVIGRKFLRVETPVFKGLFSSRLNLTGTLKQPKALGDIRIDSGSVEFPFATLKVNSGVLSIREANPYDILLDIEAGSRLFGFDVRMMVLGYASAPRLEFESDPNLGSDAVLLMLSTGEIPDRSGYYSMQQRLTKLAVYLGRSLLLEFGIGGGGGENRFIVESGRDISLKGRETYNIEVKLTDRWSLVGGYDEFDAYNGGVKWRVYAK